MDSPAALLPPIPQPPSLAPTLRPPPLPASRAGHDLAAQAKLGSPNNGETFSQFYGTNGGKGRGAGANAFGKCVSTISKHNESDGKDRATSHADDSAENDGKNSAKSHGKESASPAMTCKVMQANDLTRFQTRYGTHPNAFGKCVAGKAKSGKS